MRNPVSVFESEELHLAELIQQKLTAAGIKNQIVIRETEQEKIHSVQTSLLDEQKAFEIIDEWLSETNNQKNPNSYQI